MKALIIRKYGGPEVLQLAEMPDPVPGSGDVLVEVHAASVNPIDWKMREGRVIRYFDVPLPHVMGRDMSGVVREVGSEVRGLHPGDPVFGVGNPLRNGTQAELLAIEAELVAKKPDALTHEEAASLGVSGLSMLAALEETAPVFRGMRVLIHAGAGGVGSLAIQYAVDRGAEVFATASARNTEYVRKLGAAKVIDYKLSDWPRRAPECDVVFDTVGGETHVASQACLKPDGTLVYLNAAPLPDTPPREDIMVLNAQVQVSREGLERIAELAAAGAVRPQVTETHPLREADAAYRRSQSGHARGKIVIKIR
jgi:NADPH:quinone reductase-like Zn-dependent oxidoreductase